MFLGRKAMMRCLILAAVCGFCAITYSNTASAWSAKNCLDACRASSTTQQSYDGCVAKWQCSHYTGPSASQTKVNSYVQGWIKKNGMK